jgi:hypothetical protein
MRKRRKNPLKVRQATAYRRLAAKAWKARNSRDAERYTKRADQLMKWHEAEKRP